MMELITPGAGLIAWQIVVLVIVAFLAVAWFSILRSPRLTATDKLLWMAATLAFPLPEPLVYVAASRKME